LGLYLFNQSAHYVYSGDIIQRLKAIDEAYTTTHDL
jgi:hypothetical protein